MGTDNVELLDRRTAEIIIHATETDLISLVESRTRPRAEPPVWREYWVPDRDSFRRISADTTMEDRFKLVMSGSRSVRDV